MTRFINLCIIFLALCPLNLAGQSHELPKIVAFLGSKGVGKDTSSDFLVRRYGYKKYALANPMKVAVQSLFHFTDEQLWGDQKDVVDPNWEVTPREVMQFIGVDILFEGLGTRFPQIGHTFYFRTFDLWREEEGGPLVAVSDLRLQEDVYSLKERGAVIIRLLRPGLANDDPHVSEAAVSSVQGYDITIVNDGTIEQLEEKIDRAIHPLYR